MDTFHKMANVLEVEVVTDTHLLVGTNIQIMVHQTNKCASFAIIIIGSRTLGVDVGSIKEPMALINEAVGISIAEDPEEVIHTHKAGEEEVNFQEAGEDTEEVDFSFNKFWA